MSGVANHKVKEQSVDIDTFNIMLERCDGKIRELFQPDIEKDKVNNKVYLWTDGRQNKHLLTRDVFIKPNSKGYDSKVIHYKLDLYTLEKKEEPIKKPGLRAMNKVKKLAKEFNEKIFLDCNKLYSHYKVVPYMYENPKYKMEWNLCWSYDMNSCYPYFFNYPLPVGEPLRYNGIVKEDEIGFIFTISKNDECIELVDKGEFADIIFKAGYYKCLSKFAEEMYAEKQKDKVNKVILNALIMTFKHCNNFIRAAVLGYAKKYIQSLKDENTIMQTVDSIISLKPRKDLNIGDNIGQFKCEHSKQYFIFKSSGIKCWYGEVASHKGMKSARKTEKGYYIGNQATYDYKTNRIIRKDLIEGELKLWPELKN